MTRIPIDGTWRDVVKMYKDLLVEALVFQVDGDTIVTRDMDPSHAGMLAAEFESEQDIGAFENLCVGIDRFYKALKTYGKDEPVVLESQGDRVRLISEENGGHKVELALMEETPEEMPEPDLKHDISIEDVDISDHLKNIEKIFGVKDDYRPGFVTEDGQLKIRYSEDISSQNYEAPIRRVEGDLDVRFSSDYLTVMTGAWDLKLAQDTPLKATKTLEGGTWTVEIEYLIAPRVEDE